MNIILKQGDIFENSLGNYLSSASLQSHALNINPQMPLKQ